MKQRLHNSLRALFLSLAMLLSLPMLAEEVEIGGINYTLNADTKEASVAAMILHYDGYGYYDGEIVIPESVKYNGITYSVTSIGNGAFSKCLGLTSVTIPNSVTSIGRSAFGYSQSLTSVTIPNSVTSLGAYAFDFCTGLTSVTIGNSVTSIEEGVFFGCSGLKSVTIPNSVTSIGKYAFRACGLTSVTIPNSVTSIGDYAFGGCGLTSVTIPNSVTSIGYQAFESNSLKKIVLCCKNIGYGWFAETKSLKEIIFENNVESIGDYAFYGCSGLKSVTIPNSVKSIGDSAFDGCSSLNSVIIGNSVTSIGQNVFRMCSDLTSVTIPNCVTSIGDCAFLFCESLKEIKVEKNNPKYDSRENCNAIIETSSNTLCHGCKTTVIPNSVTSIRSWAFDGCSGLTSITIPNSVKSIGLEAFASCSGLTSVTIPNSVESIGDCAFSWCESLLDVYCYAEEVPYTYYDVFGGSNYKKATLHVPAGSIESYKTTEPWSNFGKIVVLPEVKKCATPVVTYADGKLSLTSETEDAEFVTKIVALDDSTFNTSEIELTATYNIEVYATKSEFENSDTISVALVWVENGDVSEETGVISVEATPVLIQGNGGMLNISGVAKNTEIVVYTVSGTEVARATATEGTTTINTGLQSGTFAIVKFGNKSVKIRI